MANTTYTRIAFTPISGIIDGNFMNDIEVYKQGFKKKTGYELESEEPEFTYGVDMRYNHHSLDDFHELLKEVPNLQVILSTFFEPTHSGVYHQCTWDEGLVQFFPKHILSEMELERSEDDDLENLQE